MSDDLENLRIDRPEEVHARPRASRGWMYLFFLLLLLSGGGFAYLLKNPLAPPPSEEPAEPVERVAAPGARVPGTEPRGAFTASGWVKLPLRYPILVTPLIEGRVEELRVVEGDRVEAGDVLARLYDRDLQAELEVARARMEAAEAANAKYLRGSRPQEKVQARSAVEHLEAQLATAEEILAHSRGLQPSGAISLEELQQDELKVRTLQAELLQAREQRGLVEEGFREEDVALAAASLAEARAGHELARLRLGYARIESPIAGLVLERRAEIGQWITPRTGAIVSLFDPAELEVRVDVNQDDISKVFIGQTVELSSRAAPSRQHLGRVILVEPRADEVKNTVPVRVKIEQPEGKLLFPDMVVKARFLPAESGEAEGPNRNE